MVGRQKGDRSGRRHPYEAQEPGGGFLFRSPRYKRRLFVVLFDLFVFGVVVLWCWAELYFVLGLV